MMNFFSDRLKEERKRLGLTQGELAELSAIPKRTIAGYEGGENEPGASACASLSKAGVDVLYVLTGTRAASSVVMELPPDQAALLDNYVNSTEDAKQVIRQTALLLSQQTTAPMAVKPAKKRA